MDSHLESGDAICSKGGEFKRVGGVGGVGGVGDRGLGFGEVDSIIFLRYFPLGFMASSTFFWAFNSALFLFRSSTSHACTNLLVSLAILLSSLNSRS